MNSQPIGQALKALPPDLHAQPNRFEQVRRRARRRRNGQVAGITGVIVLGGVALTGLLATGGDGTDRGIDPADQSPSETQQVLPGADRVTPLSDPRVHEGEGTQTVDLGVVPGRATAIASSLVCRTPGRIKRPDGSAMICGASDVGEERPPGLLDIGSLSRPSEYVVTAKPGVEWTLITYFVRTETTAWGVNPKGETFGVENDSGEPDLIAVMATNGKRGYLYADELDSATGGDVSNPKEAKEWMEGWPHEPVVLNVYESDGETVVGQFVTGSTSGLATAG